MVVADGLGHFCELDVDLVVFALGVLEDDVFQIPDFSLETVELGQEEFFLFCFVAETALNFFCSRFFLSRHLLAAMRLRSRCLARSRPTEVFCRADLMLGGVCSLSSLKGRRLSSGKLYSKRHGLGKLD